MRVEQKRWAGWWVMLVAVVMVGCAPTPPQATPTSEATVTAAASAAATERVTPTPSNTPSPSLTPTPFRFPPTLQPQSVCAETPTTRLIIGERARISDEDTTDLNVRAQPGANANNPPIAKLQVGDVVLVVAGPVCSDRYTWYEVDGGNVRGWVAEGDADIYYIEPFLSQ